MATPGGFSYKPNMNRAVTKKWKEANQANYDGDDWGDEEDEYGYDEPAPVSAGNARHPAWGAQGQAYPSNRSVTNPPPLSGGRQSFDRGDERRYFSSGGGGFDSAYPSTQRSPFPEPQHEYDQPQNFRPQHPLQVHTEGHGAYPPQFRPSSRGQQMPHPNAPFSAPGGYPHQRSDSGNRSNPGDMYQRRESPQRPDSQASNNSARYFPPRKSSLSQQQPPPDIYGAGSNTAEPFQAAGSPAPEAKALPFIRPSDIYKRMEEEREKERRSQDSSRPSLDLGPSRTRDSSTSARSATSDSKDNASAPVEDTDSVRRLKPTLDTVVERKSEYGFDNMLKNADRNHPSIVTQGEGLGVDRHPTNASSVYTDRRDPVSASTADDSPDLEEDEAPYSASSYQQGLPALGMVSSAGSDRRSSLTSAATSRINQPDRAPPPMPERDADENSASYSRQDSEELSHKPSLGYRSVVEQAFDHSENQNPLSPASGHDSFPRSNSASTSEISPIMSRTYDLPSGPSGPPVTERPIPEEPSSGHSRVLSDSTIRAGESGRYDQPLPAPPTIQSGFRRDRTPPSRDNSPATQPLNQQAPHQARPGYALVGRTDNMYQQGAQDDVRGRPGPSPTAAATGFSGSGGLMSPQSNHSTTSEEFRDWQDQRKQFNERFGIQDSNPTTPGLTSPISRSGSPPKGNVKDMTQRYESNSGRNTPTTTSAGDYLNARPGPQSRNESFRPQLPGGWQSSTTTPQLETPGADPVKPFQPPRLGDRSRFESTESIPTARAPTNWQQQRGGENNTAFAAAAAAGSALAGAFSGKAFSQPREQSPQRSDGEDSWERSSTASSMRAPDNSEMRDFGAAETPMDRTLGVSTPGSLPPTPLPKDTPVPTPQPARIATTTLKDQLTGSEEDPRRDDYFPAPLRMSKSVDPNEVTRPPMPAPHHTDDSLVHRDNDRLQEEIVQSLTPKSSNVEAQDRLPAAHQATTIGPKDSDRMDNAYAATGSRAPPPVPLVPQMSQDSATSDTGRRPFLEQRFSWENESPSSPTGRAATHPTVETVVTTPSKSVHSSATSPATQRAAHRVSSEAGVRGPQDISSPNSPTSTRPLSGGSEIVAPPTVLKDIGPSYSFTPGPSTHPEVPFRKILAMGNTQQRIQAFDTGREAYTHSDGMLDQWIAHMHSPEHEDIFKSTGQVRQAVVGSSNVPNRPSPGRNITGSKLVQEDGKKLMEASKRFGGKAGVAAKGLFSKGKDKWRSVSAGEKVAH